MRGVVYVGGAGRHLMDQSARVVADRIARAVERNLTEATSASYRVRLEKDACFLAPDISLDVASIEFATCKGWEPTLDVLEVKYLNRFARTFAPLSPLARAARALWVLYRFRRAKLRSSRMATGAEQPGLTPEDRNQARWLDLVALGTIGSVAYWLVIGMAALGFSIVLEEIAGWMVIPAALLLVLAEAVRKPFLEPFDRWAIEAFAGAEYQIDDKRFLAVPNAILDAIAYARQRNYGAVDLLTFSLGSLLATDTIFPRGERGPTCAPGLTIDNWITIGLPYDLIRHHLPAYFENRQPPRVRYSNWINVVVQDDFLGTAFRAGDHRGIRVSDVEAPYAPNDPVKPLMLSGYRPSDTKQDRWRPLRRVINHRIYWDDEDARAPSCFDLIVGRAQWLGSGQKGTEKPDVRS